MGVPKRRELSGPGQAEGSLEEVRDPGIGRRVLEKKMLDLVLTE